VSVSSKAGVNQRLANSFRAGYAGVYITSYEEKRVAEELAAVAAEIGWDLWTWTCTDSLCCPADGRQIKDLDPLKVLSQLKEVAGKNGDPELRKQIVILNDFHLFLQDGNPLMVRAVKDCLDFARAHQQAIVVLGCRFVLPPELEKEFTCVDFTLPTKEELSEIAKQTGMGVMPEPVKLDEAELEAVSDAAAGLTTLEAVNAMSLAIIESGKVGMPPAVVHREKANAVRKSGILSIEETALNWEQIGGLANVKEFIDRNRRAFTKEAKLYHLPQPKGIMLIGVPGCGKTLIAKCIANRLDVPLLRLDGGKLFGSLVGQSEQNTRAVIATAEAVAPCCLFCDELDKALSGSKSSGSTDGGTAARVLGTLLQWLQDKTSPVFVVATANNISDLPPELLRKGRWDEMFFVDLPTFNERAEIAGVVARKFHREAKAFDAGAIAGVTEGFTGAEIEGAFVDAMRGAFNEDREVSTEDVLASCADVVPITSTMGETIAALRKWCEGRARRASDPEVKGKAKTGRSID
jgi:AAA+ superfamily predicted ATPase